MMEYLSIQEKYGSRIVGLFEDSKYADVCKGGYAIPKKICCGGLLFIGINPSYKENFNSGFYEPVNDKFFNKQFKIGQDIGLKWSHLDLIFLRQTDQNIIKNAGKNPLLLEFLQKQYALTREILYEARPKVIVVCNAFACKWIKGDAQIKTELNEEIGVHVVKSTPLEGTPILFTGMLTGKHALDCGSFEMLEWHIKYVWKYLQN